MTDIEKSNIIEGVDVSYQDPSPTPHFQLLPAEQVERGELSSARVLGRHLVESIQVSSGSQLVKRQLGVR